MNGWDEFVKMMPSWQGTKDFLGDAFKGFTGSTDAATNKTVQGWGAPVLEGGAALWQANNATNAQKLAEEQFAMATQQFNQNWGAQKNVVNSEMHDRQKMRRIQDPNGGWDTPENYMKKWGVK